MAAIEPGAARHTIRREISVGKLINRSVLYKFSPLAAAAPLLIGTMAEKHSEPLAWRRPLAASQARMFLISFGELDDFHLFVAPILRRKRFVKAVEL